MKKIMSFVCVIALLLTAAFTFVGCVDEYEAILPIGDGNVENDSVYVYYKIASEFENGYKIKGYFAAESEANLDRTFYFTHSTDDLMSADGSYSESIMVSCKGADIADGKKFNFEIILDDVSKVFPKTADGETKTVYFVLHDNSEYDGRKSFKSWHSSSYNYQNESGSKVVIVDK